MAEGQKDLPYRVESSSEAGRFLVAARNISKGEVIVSDLPLVAGPIYTRTRPVCLECLRLLDSSCQPCTGCSLPLCGPQCQGGNYHRDECQVFREASLTEKVEDFSSNHPLYSCITPLRLLLLKRFHPADWELISTFMDHDAERQKKDSPAWRIHELLVVKLVRETLGLTQFSHKDVRRAIGILRTNSVKMEPQNQRGDGLAVYPNYTYANHSCLCNSHTRKHKLDHRLELVAQGPILQGEEIFTRYTTPQIGSFQRVADIQKTWHFSCQCARCCDPSELGSMVSALHCTQGGCSGYMLPRKPTLVGSPWSCGTCNKTVGISSVQEVMRAALDLVAAGKAGSNCTILALAQELATSLLHPNHYLIIGLKEVVIQRLMVEVRVGQLEGEQLAKALQLRSKVFTEVAKVLEMVDSQGAGWLEKAAKMEAESGVKIAQIRGGGREGTLNVGQN